VVMLLERGSARSLRVAIHRVPIQRVAIWRVANGGDKPQLTQLAATDAPAGTGTRGVDATADDCAGDADLQSRPPSRPNSGWRTAAAETPHTARARQQGNMYGYGDRYSERYRERPMSARGSGMGPRSYGANVPSSGSCTISYNTSLSPRQTIEEFTRALTECRIAFWQTSACMVRCQTDGVQFEAEVVQSSRGGSFALRFSRVAGDLCQYRDICAQLLSEMVL